MSDISPVLTKIAAGSAPQTAGAASSSGVFASGIGGAANFWDIIASQFGVSMEGEKKTTGLTNAAVTVAANTQAPTDKNPVKADNPLALLQIALASQTLDAEGNIVISAPETDPVKLQSQLELTNKVINHLKNIAPGDFEKDGLFAAIIGKLQIKSDTLQASLSALENPVITKNTPVEEIPLPLLIVLGLNPSEISEVTAKVEELEKKLGRDITVEDLIAGVGGLIAPAPEATVVAATAAPKSTTQNILDAVDNTAEPTDNLAAKLNMLDVGGEEPDADADVNTEEPDLFKGKMDSGATEAKIKKDFTTFKENLTNLLNANKAQQGDMIFPVASFGTETDSAFYQQFGVSATTAVSYGSAAQAANLIASSATAGQPHPATQMVSAMLVKNAKNGDDNIMTLRLDPPELGNVNVRLQFGKDKTVKAIITAEKPETYMMLQRDAHSLERALQSSGLETSADGITFELADNGTFAQNNDGESGGEKNFGAKGNGAQDADAGDIIQSTVSWHIDPSTGHVRYNIFA